MAFDINKKAIPIRISDFKEFFDYNYYYIDKSLLIKDILENRSKVTLFTRPRRFGKTLNLSTLKYFFEKTDEDNSYLFKNLKIWQAGEKYKEYQGKYPIINLDFKSIEALSWEIAYEKLKFMLSNEYSRHSYLLDNSDIIIESKDKEIFQRIRNNKATEVEYTYSIKNLCVYLERYYNQKPIILIDEYDVPLQRAYISGYYKLAINFFRGLLQDALKTNSSLEFAIITGCLRISKESIFTGLNNLDIISILNKQYSEHFGFTQEEVDEILKYYNLEEKMKIIKKWYDGYQFGITDIYNPWSLLKCVKTMIVDKTDSPEAYWVNTSKNDIVKKLIKYADEVTKNEIETLINGGTIEKALNTNITYNELNENLDNIWSMLFFTGYLTYTEKRKEERTDYYRLKIPNEELLYIYETIIKTWFKDRVKEKDFNILYQSLIDGSADELRREINKFLLENISFYDVNESFYYGIFTGVFSRVKEYRLHSNLESGHGRSDIILEPIDDRKAAIVIELKVAKKLDELEQKCDEALTKIENKKYTTYLQKRGYDNIIPFSFVHKYF